MIFGYSKLHIETRIEKRYNYSNVVLDMKMTKMLRKEEVTVTMQHSHFPHIRSLKRALLLSFTLLICALIAILSYYFFGILLQSKRWKENNFQQVTSLSIDHLGKMLSDSQEAARIAAYSAACQKYLLSDNANQVIEARRLATDIMGYANLYGDNFKDIVLLSPGGRKLSNTNSYTEIVTLALEASSVGKYMHFSKPFYSSLIQDQSKQYLVYLFPVFGNIDGYHYKYNPLVGSVVYDMDDLLKLAKVSGYEECITILRKNGTLLGSSSPLSEKEISFLSSVTPDQSSLRIKDLSYFLRYETIKHSDLELIFLMPGRTSHAHLTEMVNFPVLLITLFLFLIVVLMVWVLRELRYNISNMTEDIRLAERSMKPVNPPYIDELVPISQVLNKTFLSLEDAYRREQQLMANSYEALLAQARAEMLAYRSQINPHFLFNTLESARSMARHYGAELLEELIGGMSRMFRYSLYAPMIVPFSEELSHLNSYLYIIETRFPGRYRVLRALSEDTLNWPVLSMTLQPLVENTLQHAFAGQFKGVILIQSFERNGRLIIRVADNGSGMSPETLTTVLRNIRDHSGEPFTGTDGMTALSGRKSTDQDISIGLTNIHRRLKLTFGETAELHIRSREGYYTVVELEVPRKGLD